MISSVELMPTAEHRAIAAKVYEGQRITPEEGIFLVQYPDSEPLIQLADWVRVQKAGESVHFASTLFIHPTNLCELSCSFCSFYAKPGWKSAWFQTPDQIMEQIKSCKDAGLNEVHIVGGLWRECNLDYYQELFTKIKAFDSKLHIKALTAVEYDYLARLHDISVEEVFIKMMGWGLGSLPGGGAEVLGEEIHKKLAPQKISGKAFLEVHKTAHRLGLPSNITMLYGSIEEWEDLVEHLDMVRTAQDETNGFLAFIPLKYHIENNALGKRTARHKPKDSRRVFALSRLMLDNIESVKVLWNYHGIDDSKELLNCGANDFASTALDEKIIVMAGGLQIKMDEKTIREIILSQNRIPIKVHSGKVV